MDKLYTVHSYFNRACSDAGVETELLVNEDDLKVIVSPKPLRKIVEGLHKVAITNGIITKTRNSSCGSMVLICSDPKVNTTATMDHVENRFGSFYRTLNEAIYRESIQADLVKLTLSQILQGGHISTPDQVDQQAQNAWFNSSLARKAFPGRDGYKAFGSLVREQFEKQNEDRATEQGYDKLANGWIGTGRAPKVEQRSLSKANLKKSLSEALEGIAVPDGAAQPKVGVEMLNQALAAQTKSGTTLKDALKKQGITWHVAEPGSHVIVFKSKNGEEKWRVEPMTLSDKKVFEATMEALWSVALGKSPNAKELEREAAKQRAKELSDHQKEITGLVDQITGKYAPPAQEEENVTR